MIDQIRVRERPLDDAARSGPEHVPASQLPWNHAAVRGNGRPDRVAELVTLTLGNVVPARLLNKQRPAAQQGKGDRAVGWSLRILLDQPARSSALRGFTPHING
ncbi:hypothetical protein G7043_25425 [Lentzea sp. NEAU-D13]|uniref:Uncharacterized protein n=1 Tax=Lentzea alba TaxID=2714351 RepID=A0A7C9RT97_9PSEU|nr:hypothetical protein [Lentzea alba]NGY62268.1 hypothetical protein [Lentzea alba]